MKKLTVLLLVFVMIFAMAACSDDTVKTTQDEETVETAQDEAVAEEAEEGPVVYFVSIMQGGDAWSKAEEGFNDACTDLGWEGYFVAPSTANDTATMVELTETAITNGAEVLIGAYYSSDIFGDVCKAAHDDGIYVVSTNCFMGEEYQDFWIGTDPVGMGVAQAETLVNVIGDSASTVVYMQTGADIETQNDQYTAFCEYLEDYDNITVWGQEYCNSDAVVAAETIANLVKANPEINACVCADSMGCLGIGNYVDENNLQGSFYGIGIGSSSDILNYVLTGALVADMDQDFYTMGYESCVMVKTLIEGGSVDFANDSGTIVIMPEDVEEYAAQQGIELN